MTGIPAAAVAVIAAALDDYRLTTPQHSQTPHGAAERAGEYLATSGWGLYVPLLLIQIPEPTKKEKKP
ncbi:hypothetical protein PYK79_41415, partial [Streptomyces sp. ID05-04B]|uniref:hypothetical protein n=1 Tax=Streptomyces sp. ID05-04B TaxID=3028661 RepID=UPI0029C502EE